MLKPRTFPIGTKRMPLDTNYYDDLQPAERDLVDLKRTPLQEITPDGIRTSGGHHELDIIVYATGYDALTGPLEALGIRGRGRAARWPTPGSDGPRTYLGLAVPGFPNLLTITGPGSPSVLSNMPVSIEQHVEWISDCLSPAARAGRRRIEATDEATTYWTDARAAGRQPRPCYPKAASWYMGANIPGKPRIFLPYIGGVGSYRARCDEVAGCGYEGFTLSGIRPNRASGDTGQTTEADDRRCSSS